MERFKAQLKEFILKYLYYDTDGTRVAIVKRDELAKLLNADQVRFKE